MSPSLFALDCTNFGITITNETVDECVLKSSSLFYGYLFSGMVPLTIPSKATSPKFYLQQDDIGAGIQLNYRCNAKSVSFYSGQEHCNWVAGGIGGDTFGGNDLNVEYQYQYGSRWSNKAGEISWRIF